MSEYKWIRGVATILSCLPSFHRPGVKKGEGIPRRPGHPPPYQGAGAVVAATAAAQRGEEDTTHARGLHIMDDPS